jgi:hypothetical protein
MVQVLLQVQIEDDRLLVVYLITTTTGSTGSITNTDTGSRLGTRNGSGRGTRNGRGYTRANIIALKLSIFLSLIFKVFTFFRT